MEFKTTTLANVNGMLAMHEIARRATKPRQIVGVYFLVRNGVVVYVGKSIDVAARIHTHIQQKEKKFDAVFVIECPLDLIDDCETAYIGAMAAEYNVHGAGNRFEEAVAAILDYQKAIRDEEYRVRDQWHATPRLSRLAKAT